MRVQGKEKKGQGIEAEQLRQDRGGGAQETILGENLDSSDVMVSIVPKATGLTSAEEDEEDKKSLRNLRTAVLVEGSSKMLGCWNQGGTGR